ncbi:Effector protein PevD1 [Colletotrichum sidae]|uniref:Effector protein PevD1 n=1 Tax=Colletotrichum sidae TaxID=1347389 RepID=A0A4V6QFN8_9PEZI|nr:Effector protein PevD1 [Colletotrichum sidae]
MQLTLATVTALFGAAALAAPAPQAEPLPNENVKIADFAVRKGLNGTITNVYFSLTGNNATDLPCSGANPAFPSDVINCVNSDSKYRFTLRKGTKTDYALRIFHELSIAAGFWGEGDVPSYCHTGGLGQVTCNQVGGPIVINIDATGPPINP